VLYSLSRRPNGAYPQGGLIAYERSVLIGTTLQGGANCSHYYNGGCGTIFKMTSSGGAWTGHLVYKFTGGADGTDPEGSLIADATGDLYGTTANGGAACPAISAHGCGAVFKLTPTKARKTSFAESVLYAFQGGAADGANPQAALTIGATGALYGTTFAGGGSGCYGPGCGTVFKLTP
jgi:uncharacterized repeat protein (TIGR03803 family)